MALHATAALAVFLACVLAYATKLTAQDKDDATLPFAYASIPIGTWLVVLILTAGYAAVDGPREMTAMLGMPAALASFVTICVGGVCDLMNFCMLVALAIP